MGMDLMGCEPISTHGEYFRASIWRWPTLWKLVCDSCGNILTKEDKEAGKYNGGHFITKSKAMQIGTQLWSMLRSGKVAAYAAVTPPVGDEGAAELTRIMDEALGPEGEICSGTVSMSPAGVVVLQSRPAKPEPLDLQVVAAFADFCLESGGFRICDWSRNIRNFDVARYR